jgi:N-acetylglutamate synthase-like GNAT family acetyltransferase
MNLVRVAPHQLGAILKRPINFPIVAYAAMDGDKVLGAGALSWIDEQCWLEFTALNPDPKYAVHVVRQGQRLLRQAEQVGEKTVFSLRDDTEPQSARLLSMLGFERRGVYGGFEVWAWER